MNNKEILNEVVKQSNELLEYLETSMEVHVQNQQELDKLEIQRNKAMKLFYSLGGIASGYTLMFVIKIVMAIIG